MCGISGTAGFANREQLGAMNDAILHRGPDDGGVEIFMRGGDPWVGLTNRRLAIIDLSAAGHMPMKNEDGSVALTYNGEVFNFSDLRHELQERGSRFRSHTDTEVILRLYEAEGIGMLRRLNGMFALAIWDAPEQRLVLARDGFGIKPLYYMPLPGGKLAFASEIKSLIRGGLLQPEIDPEALHYYLNFLWVPGPKTMFKGVFKLMPGHVLQWKDGVFDVRQWWEFRPPTASDGPIDERELAGELREHLRNAVKRHLVSDVPLGVFLSGGLDSSTLLAFATEIERRPMKAYTIAFRGEDAKLEQSGDDRKYARIVAQSLGAEHHEIEVQPDIVDLLPHVVWHMDEPVADPAAITSYLICRAAREDLTVLLSGQGGDEIFGGYRVHLTERLTAPLRKAPRSLRHALLPAWDLLPAVRNRVPGVRAGKVMAVHRYVRKMIAAADFEPAGSFVFNRSYYAPGEQNALYTPGFSNAVSDYDAYETHLTHFADVPDADFLEQMLYVDQKTFLPELNLTYSDKMSMAASVEVRVPLLDRELVSFMQGVPARLKVRGMKQKYLFKKAMEGILPREVIWRGKAGFGAPIRNWLKRDLKPMLEDLLSQKSLEARGFFEPAAIRALIDDNEKEKADNAYRIWALMTFELWCRIFVDQKAA
jgi:asparagine synthase (glutamine-hydrolysing)